MGWETWQKRMNRPTLNDRSRAFRKRRLGKDKHDTELGCRHFDLWYLEDILE